MDLALNNRQRLKCHKTQQTNQPINRIVWKRTFIIQMSVKTDWYLFEFLVIHKNTWNHLTVRTQMIDSK